MFARNLTRDLEVFLPLTLVFHPQALVPSAPGWAGFLAGLWLFVFLFLPLFNRDRLRVGDLVGGTRVVVAPKATLLEDVGVEASGGPSGEPGRQRHTFTAEQLEHYGNFELQVLEDLLRREHDVDIETLQAVCDKIKRRIRWPRAQWKVDTPRFLRDFYTAQRARLEHGMLFGRRFEDKRSARAAARRAKK